MIPDDIRRRIGELPILAGIPDSDVERLLEEGTVRKLAPDEVFIVEGEVANGAFLIVEGEVEIVRSAGDGDVVVATRQAGELVGEMALMMEARRNATVRARTPAIVLEISAAIFQSMLVSRPETAIAMIRTVWERLQAAEAHLVQHQKMAALGTLAAGLAHELNNPAAALIRSTGQLEHLVSDWEQQATGLGSLNLTLTELEVVREVVSTFEQQKPLSDLDPVARADLEEALGDWLAAHQVAQSWRLASILADTGRSVEDLDAIAARLAPEHLSEVLWWLANGAMVHGLLHELALSARAISEIVSAVKGYTRLDQAPVQEVDLHEGIEQALIILRHKLKGISIQREYAEKLPEITAFASELNQVWTNLIDNAADAMGGEGTLTIRTRLEPGEVIVEIEDSGPGIPESAQECIFDPFFTTKPPGQGTGLGLAITFNIIRKHHGDIRLRSQPGTTCFAVYLPLSGCIDG